MSDDIIKLDVGGTIYKTTKSTLVRYPNSMLGAMFDDSMPKMKDENGCYFIDRDGSLFQYILNYLRSPELPDIADVKLLSQLAIEADFFQIEPLIQAIKEKKSRTSYGHFLEIRSFQGDAKHTYTIICACTEVIDQLPLVKFLSPKITVTRHEIEGKPHFTRLRVEGAFIRLRLVEYLHNKGWVLIESADEPKDVVFVIRERWYLKTDKEPDL